MRKETSFLEIGLNRKRNSRRHSFVARTSERLHRRRFRDAVDKRRFDRRLGRKTLGVVGRHLVVVDVVVVVAGGQVAVGRWLWRAASTCNGLVHKYGLVTSAQGSNYKLKVIDLQNQVAFSKATI